MGVRKVGITKSLKNFVESLVSPLHKKHYEKDYDISVNFLYEGKIVPGIWGEELSYPLTREQKQRLEDAGYELYDIIVKDGKIEYIFEERCG